MSVNLWKTTFISLILIYGTLKSHDYDLTACSAKCQVKRCKQWSKLALCYTLQCDAATESGLHIAMTFAIFN